MLKKIQFKFAKIKYTGKSIGNDVCVDVELLDKIIRVDKKIATGKTVEINQEIGSFLSDQNSFVSKIKITITEKDILFNDVGSIEGKIKVDINSANPRKSIYILELRENRFGKNWGKSTAKFEVTIEATIMEVIKYIPDVDNGWLKVKIANGETAYLQVFLKVRSDYTEKGREYFTILEGSYNNQKASVSLDIERNNGSRLLTDVQLEQSIYLQYSISKRKLIVGNKNYNATDESDSPWKKGWYDIELPDYPHTGGRNYEKRSIRAKTWFRIGHEGDRYLHTGRRSLGCITITEVEKWDEIYNKLIKARKGDLASVGVLEVID